MGRGYSRTDNWCDIHICEEGIETMYVITMSFGVGLVSIGAFRLLEHFGILQYSPAFPFIVFGLTLMILSLREYVKVRGDRYE